jgi:DNA polymerase-3 subunit gamma/tau
VEAKKDQTNGNSEVKINASEPFSPEQLRAVWMEFAEKRKVYQAEYHLLAQEYDLLENKITVALLHPFQETMLNNLRSEITTYLRERLKNNSILVTGELKVTDDKKIIYTNREKFDFLIEKNPLLKELKDRLGLDTDF